MPHFKKLSRVVKEFVVFARVGGVCNTFECIWCGPLMEKLWMSELATIRISDVVSVPLNNAEPRK
jgi:hypothetical protein